MNVNKYLLFSAAVLALASCSQDKLATEGVDGKPAEGNSYMSMSVSLAATNSRASNENQFETGGYIGLANEQKLSTIDFFLDKNAVKSFAPTADAGTGVMAFEKTTSGSDVIAKTDAFEVDVPKGEAPMALVINRNDLFQTDAVTIANAANMTVSALDSHIADMDKIASVRGTDTQNKGMLMTSKIVKKTIQVGIDKATASASGIDDSKNRFELEVKRVAARGVVMHGEPGVYKTTADGKYYYEVKNGDEKIGYMIGGQTMVFSSENNAVKTYLFDGHNGQSAIHTVPASADPNQYKDSYARLGALYLQAGGSFTANAGKLRASNRDLLANYKAKSVAEYTSDTKTPGGLDKLAIANSIYLLENSWEKEANELEMVVGYNRMPYAKVYGFFVPAKMSGVTYLYEKDGQYYVSGQNDPVASAEGYTQISGASKNMPKYKDAGSTVHDDYTIYGMKIEEQDLDVASTQPITIGGVTYTISATSFGQFYYSNTTKKFYVTLEAALFDAGFTQFGAINAENKAKVTANPSTATEDVKAAYETYNKLRKEIFTYQNGYGAYRALWNRIEDRDNNNLIKKASVDRNNLYILEIGGFSGLPMPYDLSDPQDPHLPQTATIDGQNVNVEKDLDGNSIGNDDPSNPGTNPNTPGNNPDPNDHKAFMSVTAKVVPLTVSKRTVSFSGKD